MAGVKLAGVLGDPVAHSKSPLMHNHWLKTYGIAGIYAPVHVKSENFEQVLHSMFLMGFAGANVTVPHKEAAFEACDLVSDAARRARSVNTLQFLADGAMVGDSTDGYGFLENIRAGAPGFSFEGSTVAMLGAGGAARAVAFAMADAGVQKIRLINRTQERAENLAQALGDVAEVWSWPVTPAIFEGADLLVNGTTLGMHGGPEFSFDLPSLSKGVVATDLIYTPLETPFLSAARLKGATIVDGLGMLLHQGRPGFERWFGVSPEVTPQLRELVLSGSGCLP